MERIKLNLDIDPDIDREDFNRMSEVIRKLIAEPHDENQTKKYTGLNNKFIIKRITDEQ